MNQIEITLEAARINAGLSQDDVAREMGVSRATILAWEKGKTEPRISQGRKLSLLYGIPLDNISIPVCQI